VNDPGRLAGEPLQIVTRPEEWPRYVPGTDS